MPLTRFCRSSVLAGVVVGFALVLGTQGARAAADSKGLEPGSAFDAAPFGFAIREADGRGYGVRWGEPRKIRRVVVEFDGAAPPADKVRLQYWHSTWNGRPDPILAEHGAGGVGWAATDDWTNGRWKDADTRLQADGTRWMFTFAPTGETEFEKLGHPGVAYRRTLKVRLISDVPLSRPKRLQTFTDAVCRPLTVRIRWGHPAPGGIPEPDGDDPCRLEAYNGAVVAVRAIPGGTITTHEGRQWLLRPGAESGVEADVVMAVDPANGHYDRTILTVRSKYRPFSFAADEAARGDRILVDDLGVLVTRGDDAMTLEGCRTARCEFAGRTIYDRVLDEGEQTLARAWNDMPLKRPLYFVHGLPGDRNAMHQKADGTIEITSSGHWFQRPPSPRDTDRKHWSGDRIALRFGFPDAFRGGRELKDGYLPILRTWWQEGPIQYELTSVLDKLDGDLRTVAIDDPTVLLMQLRLVNTSANDNGTARLHLQTRHADSEKLYLEHDRAMAVWNDRPRIRCLLLGDRGEADNGPDGVRCRLELGPGQSRRMLLLVPSITINDEEADTLARRDFDADCRRIAGYWRAITDRGTRIDTPEPWLNDFHKAHLRHLLVNCYKEKDTDRLHAHVGTFGYGVYPDESGMMISDLDRRGYHDEARRCLDSYLAYQGTVQMPGNFKTTEGLFYGSGGHDTGGYNKSHGWVMWNMADHWLMTRDRAWMERAAPKLVASCDWVTRERKATMVTNEDGTRPIEYGWLPSGSLEDVTDYWYWMVTNACTVWGFRSLADALADYGHPEAGRLQKDAEAYRRDFMAAMTEARIRTPVVRLRDGTYVPKYPSHLHERGRCHGWLRETLEGSIHLLITGLVPPDAPEARWILNDFEDNLFISEDYGYAIPAFDTFWFSRGGFSMQANLLGHPLPYLYRDDIRHYLRGYFNAFASAFYPEIRMCNEHSLPELGYPAGDHFKSSDEAQSTYWLRLIFVHERGGDLYLGQAVPRYWLADGRSVGIERAPSQFGPLSLRITSRAAAGEIRATVDPPQRNRPRTIYVRFRHPDARPIRGVTVNGEPYDRFDAKKEWVVLPGDVSAKQEIVARY